MSEIHKSALSKRWIFVPLGLFAAIALIIWLVHYFLVGQYFITTDDAYIAADSSLIAPKISGYITEIPVRDGQAVQPGQRLAVIDPRDYQIALAAAQADVAAAQASIATDTAALSLQQAKIAAAQATLQGDEARLAFATQNLHRYASLSASGASTKQNTEEAKTTLATTKASLAADQAALLGATRDLGVLHASLAHSLAAQAQAQASATQAALNLSHTSIRSPFAGIVGNKTVALGDYLQPGNPIMAIVPLAQVYVIANYKETQITNIRPGQPVRLTVDAYPGLKVTGRVDAISPASGQEFALLPPDNATGNFTKIVQRVPVKIILNLTPDLIGKLRPGLSVEPAIDTRHHS
ncbi:MAG: HlyD family secretion protein [Acidocella sp.]|nr:HlyD family secretion protein [Acidocella sp.]